MPALDMMYRWRIPSSMFSRFSWSSQSPATTAFVHTEWPRFRLEAHKFKIFCASDVFESFLRRHSRPCSHSSVCVGSALCAVFSQTQRRSNVTPALWSYCCAHTCVCVGSEQDFDRFSGTWEAPGGAAEVMRRQPVKCWWTAGLGVSLGGGP